MRLYYYVPYLTIIDLLTSDKADSIIIAYNTKECTQILAFDMKDVKTIIKKSELHFVFRCINSNSRVNFQFFIVFLIFGIVVET